MVVGFNNGQWNKNTNILDIKVIKCGDCDYMKQQPEEKIYVPFGIWSEWQWIMKKMGAKEWQAVYDVKNQEVFEAEDDKPAVMGYVVTAYRIPKQTVTGTSAEFINSPEHSEMLKGDGIIHSHHGLGLHQHSSQDDEQSRNLYDWSILLFDSGVTASKRIKSPCGGFGYVKASVYLLGCPEIDLSNIEEKTYGAYTGYTSPASHGTYCDVDDEEVGGQPKLPFQQDIFQTEECDKCRGTGISDQQTVCEKCKGAGELRVKSGEAKDEILESDVAFRCNKCHKFFDLPSIGCCPHCNNHNWRKTTAKELKAIAADEICKKCPETNCSGCPVEVPDITEYNV